MTRALLLPQVSSSGGLEAWEALQAAASLCVVTCPPPYDFSACSNPFATRHPAVGHEVAQALLSKLFDKAHTTSSFHWFRITALATPVSVCTCSVRNSCAG